ncbi:MAG: DeoR family transcriptional regulator [Anaerolineales bacterium]|nr:DeoR family transcriptional regulator [Anaerolineales bacterium]
MNEKPAGHIFQGTRQQILEALKMSGGSTVQSLAETVDVSPVTVRHHLGNLQADRLVNITLERRSVGRPHHVYSLSQEGENQFPQQYLNLSKRLLNQIQKTYSPPEINQLFKGIARDIIEQNIDNLKGKSGIERLALLLEIMEDEGLMAQWEEENGDIIIQTNNCPYRALIDNHPEVCALDHSLISVILDVPVEKIDSMQEGSPRCTFKVKSSHLKKDK